jgi:hypothetical protein
MKKKLLIVIMASFFNVPIYGGDFNWWHKLEQIKPLRSTRADVEQLFGASYDSGRISSYYEVGENRLLVEYSKGNCADHEKGEWNTPEEVMIKYDFNIFTDRNYPILKDFARFAKIDLRPFRVDTYENIKDTDTPSMVPHTFDNEKSGIYLDGFRKGYKNDDGTW